MTNKGTDRRAILALMGAGAAVAGIGGAAADAANPVIEWNMHMFARDTTKFPYGPRATYRPDPAKNPTDPLAAYLAHMKEFGIDRAVIVQPEPYGDDHKLVLDCLARTSPQQMKGTSLFYPKDADAPAKLEALVKAHPRICSTRFHLHSGNKAYFTSFSEPGVRALWKKAVDLNLVVELDLGPTFARDAGQAIAAFPGCKVLIDHMANPKTGKIWEYGDVLDLAKYPNVYMKLSQLSYMTSDKPNYESLIPFTRRVIKEFGPDRMVWSGDSPHIVDVHMKGYSAADIAKVKGGNLKRLLNW
ncbi:MAG TPA: amidohydrolase family protein [Rhizomicrobium sp.]|jgi:predicted TIM-barrel fold metal-dependent hydrolase|nr:amidohydrolase family protein [Rhizomicrobium sp.]